jgi:hypothetical protein
VLCCKSNKHHAILKNVNSKGTQFYTGLSGI